MARQQRIKGLLERGSIQRTADSKHPGIVECQAFRIELLEKPEPLLTVGQGNGTGIRPARHRPGFSTGGRPVESAFPQAAFKKPPAFG